MNHLNKILALVCIFFSPILLHAQEKSKNYGENRIIIKFNATCTPEYTVKDKVISFSIPAIDELNRKYNCYAAKRINAGRKSKKASYTYVLRFSGNIDVLKAIEEYKGTGCLVYAEPDYTGKAGGVTSTVPDDTYFSRQWSLYNNGTSPYDSARAGADIKMEPAWDIEKGDTSIVVAIIDCGAKLDHPELAGRIWINYGEIPGNGIDDDGNGYVDDYTGWDFAYSDNNPMDHSGHGTNVAGIIGAIGNNSTGYAGVDWYCKLMVLKAIDDTDFGYYSWWADALTYATDNGARIVNMSVGGTSYSATLQDAVTYAYDHNVTVVAAMGNGNSSAPSYPGACTNVIAVGATNDHDCRVNPFFWGGGSNFGPNISVVAPGSVIFGLNYASNTNYNTYWGGTSQATPHVSGLASLLLAQDTSRTPDQLKHIIEVTADDMVGSPLEDVPGWDQYYGYGRINAYRALTYSTTAIQNVNSEGHKVTIYPNPSTGRVLIQTDFLNEPVNYSVMNVTGSIISQGVFSGPIYEINLARQPEGTYIIRLNNQNFSYVQKESLQ